MTDRPADELPASLQAVEPLGEGAFGKVYRAVDGRGRPVAVKVLAAELANRADVAWQFAGEFRKLARLDHPGFPAAYEEGRTPAGLPYYAMELVGGASPAGPLAPAVVRSVLVGVAEALAHLHGRGWVHGDLKPDNVRVAEGAVKLLDVGLMARAGEKRESIAGTLEYLAPEALRKAPVAPAADLYALGVLGFELWTGQPPFTGGPGELVRAHLQAPPPALPGDDPELAALLTGLLAKEPSARPATAWAVLAALGVPVDPHLLAGRPAMLQGAGFVGRDEVLGSWRATLAQGGQLAFGGGAGLGKSRTLDELRLAAQLAGRAWVGAACTGTGEAPGAPARALVGQALALAGQAPTGVVAAWLAGELPAELLDLEPATRAVLIAAAVAEALAAAARTLGGLALGLDDFHLADGATKDFVAYWGRARAGEPVAWALAGEPADPLPAGFLALPPLTPAEVAALVAGRLGAEAPAALLDLLGPAAQGSPLLVDLLLEHLVGAGRLVPTDAGWALAGGEGGALPASLAAAWEARLAGLSDAARRLGAIAAVAAGAGGASAPVLARVAGLDDGAWPDAVEALLARGVAVEREGRLGLAMAGMAEVLLGPVPAAERARWAGELAAEVLGAPPAEVDPAGLPTDVLTRAAWLALAGPDAAAACRLAVEAGRRGLALGATADALALLEAAEAVLPADAPGALALALRFHKAEAERFLDRLPDAGRDYEAAVPLATEPALAARVLNGLAKVRQLQNDFEVTLDLLGRAVAQAAAAGDAGQEARAAIMEARVRLFQGKLPEALAASERAVERARAGGARAFLGQGLTLLAALLVQADPANAGRSLALLDEALALAASLGDRLGEGLAQENQGNTHLALGDLAAAGEAFAACGATFRAIGKDTEALSAGLNQAIVAAERADLDVALAIARDVDARARAVNRKFPQVAAKTALGQALWRDGRPAEALAPLDDALALAEEIKNKYLQEHVRLYRLEALLALGEHAAAVAEAAQVRALAEATGHAEALARLEVLEARAAWLAGDATTARTRAAAQAGNLNRVVAHAAHTLLAEVEAPAEALEAARRALDVAGGWRSPWHEATALVQEARLLLQLGRRDEAAARAREARARAEAGRNPYARARAALALAEAGVRTEDRELPRRAATELRGVLAGLAPQAAEALLAAQGLSALAGELAAGPGLPAEGVIGVAALAAAMQAVALETGEGALAEAVLQVAIALVEAERGYVLSYEGGRLREAVTRGLDYAGEQARFSHTIAERVLFGGEPVYVTDASADETWKAAASVMALGLRTVACVPMAAGTDLLGVLYLEREALEPVLTERDVQALAALASFATALIVAERARQAAGRQASCAALGLALAGNVPRREARQALLVHAAGAAGAARAMWLVQRGDKWEAGQAVDAAGAPLTGDAARVSQGISGWVAERQEPLAILDTSSDEAWEARQSVQALGLRTVWCLPVGDDLVYLDAADAAHEDPMGVLRTLETLVDFAIPLVSNAAT